MESDGIWSSVSHYCLETPEKISRQIWNSYHALGVIWFHFPDQKTFLSSTGGILLSTWSLSTSFGFSKPDCLDIKPIYKPHYCSNHMAVTSEILTLKKWDCQALHDLTSMLNWLSLTQAIRKDSQVLCLTLKCVKLTCGCRGVQYFGNSYLPKANKAL